MIKGPLVPIDLPISVETVLKIGPMNKIHRYRNGGRKKEGQMSPSPPSPLL